MPLENTFVYNPEDAQAPQRFEQILQEESILMLVFGKEPFAQHLAAEADGQANQSPFGVKRYVIWLPSHNIEQKKCLDLLSSLSSFDPAQYTKIAGFSVKPVSNKAADVLFPEEMPDEITMLLRVKRAYARAGQDFRVDL